MAEFKRPFRETIAEIYRLAALEGKDMRRFAEALEPLAESLKNEDSVFHQWGRLDTKLGESLFAGRPAEELVFARKVFTDIVVETLYNRIIGSETDPENQWKCWLKHFGEAVYEWRTEAVLSLCDVRYAEAFGERFIPFSFAPTAFLERTWPCAYQLFEILSEQNEHPAEWRAHALYICGQIKLYHTADYEGARILMESIGERAPDHALRYYGQAEYYMRSFHQRDQGKTLDYLERALVIEKNTPEISALILYGDLCSDQEKWLEAEETYLKAREKNPGARGPYNSLIQLYSQKSFFESKKAEMERLSVLLTFLDPLAKHLIYLDAGSHFQQNGDMESAERFFALAHAEKPDCLGLMLTFAEQKANADPPQLEAAGELYRRAIETYPKVHDGYFALARFQEANGAGDEAALTFHKVMELIPEWERYMSVRIGYLYIQKGDFAGAEECFLKALALDPYDDSGALTEIYALAEKYYKEYEKNGKTVEEGIHAAVNLLHRAEQAQTGKNGAEIVNRKGHVYFYHDLFLEALPYYQNASAAIAEPVYHSNQAKSLENQFYKDQNIEHLSEAVKALSAAEEISKTPEDRQKYRKQARKLEFLQYNPAAAQFESIKDVYIDVGAQLIPEVTADFKTLKPELLALIDRFRADIRARYGINFPFILFRELTGDAGANYRFCLNEAPVQFGALPADMEQNMASVLKLFQQFLQSHYLDLYVNYWDVEAELPGLPPRELVHFTQIAMALLWEGAVPLGSFTSLYHHYQNVGGRDLSVPQAIEKIRLAPPYKKELQGAQAGYKYALFHKKTEEKLIKAMKGQGNARAMVVPLTVCSELSEIFNRYRNENERWALVTQDAEIRSFVRNLALMILQLDIPVLKKQELPADYKDRLLPEIELSNA